MVNFRIFLNFIFIIFIVQSNNIFSSFTDIDKTPSADSGFVGGNPLLGDLRSDRGRKMKAVKDNASNSSSKADEASAAASDAQADLGAATVDVEIANPKDPDWAHYTLKYGIKFYINMRRQDGTGLTQFGLSEQLLDDRHKQLLASLKKDSNSTSQNSETFEATPANSQPASKSGTWNGDSETPINPTQPLPSQSDATPTTPSGAPAIDPDLPNADNTVGFGDGIIGNQTGAVEENKIKAKSNFFGKTRKFVVKNPLLVLAVSTITVGATAYAASAKVRKKVHETINDIKTGASNFKTRVINYWQYLKNRPVRVKDAVGLGLGLTAFGFGVKYANQANNKWNITGKIKEDWQKLNFLQKLVAVAAPLVAVYLAKEVARDAKIIYEKTGNNKPNSKDSEIQTRKRSNSI